jgi:WD40 repeat protein
LRPVKVTRLSIEIAGRHGPRAGIIDTYEGHQGPIRGMDCHNSQGPIDFSHLFLTSSVDWTVKLWSLKVRIILFFIITDQITNPFLWFDVAGEQTIVFI